MSTIQINLLPKKEKHLREKFLYFALHYFRYIIVLTQIVVISVFFFRFYIDQQIIDLKEKFQQKQQILTITYPLIQEAKALETKTKEAKHIMTSQQLFLATISYVFSRTHPSALLDSVKYTEEFITLKGSASSISAIRSMQTKLLQSGKFKAVTAKDVSRQSEQAYNFIILIEL